MKATNRLPDRRRAGWVKWVAALAVGMCGPDAVGQTPPRGDYGDAPDGGPTYYELMFPTSSATGRFPTLYNTTNSRLGQPGICHLLGNLGFAT